MRFAWRQLLHRRQGLPVALWLLLLLSANALQVVAATHWHSHVISVAASAGTAPPEPMPDGVHHDDCLLCQAAAHAGASAPPSAPWTLFTVLESHSAALLFIAPAARPPRPSHSWQGRAPPPA